MDRGRAEIPAQFYVTAQRSLRNGAALRSVN